MHGLETLLLLNAGGMPVRFTTLVLKKAAIRASYPGGMSGFLRDHPRVLQDQHLIGLAFMSTGEVWETVEVLRGQGYDMEAYGVLDETAGPIMYCGGVEYFMVDLTVLGHDWRGQGYFPKWRVRATQEIRLD